MKSTPFAAALACALALSACAHAGAGGERTLAAGEAAPLRPGDSVALPDRSRLRFVEVTSDSRCRPGLQCIRAGEAVLAFELTGGDGAKTALSFDTSAPQPRQRAGAWTLELQSLDFAEPPQATVKLEAE
ncbi:hypothetical protein SAMN04487939_102254 [Lysobacter sp. yr284]|uniref:hypothetical protein n=1 Tax=Lysobacter sp. yr284 TaxID=1761791 RepID=UPI0008981B8A|nr:hypothetical protein [Lysobacter sp. yr284]SDY46288.1 hypothetical protein SAMN04487939_102254 [Lysobacter sp. yr284]